VHGGGQAPDQFPIGVDRLQHPPRGARHDHPMGNMLALMSMLIGGVIPSLPEAARRLHGVRLRLAAVLARAPRRALRADAEQAPAIDRKPSEYFLDGNCFISCEPDEHMLPQVIELIGDDRSSMPPTTTTGTARFPTRSRSSPSATTSARRARKSILGDNARRCIP
jgi:hypothetical protein